MVTLDSRRTYLDSPDPLALQCLEKIIREPVNLCRYILPPELGDLIATGFRVYALASRLSDLECIKFFKHFKHKYVPLSKIDFSGLPITDGFFLEFLEEYRDQLEEINISKCPKLTSIDLKKLNELLKNNMKSHKTLIIGETFAKTIEGRKDSTNERLFDDDLKLKKLVLHKIHLTSDVDEFSINRQLSTFLTPTMSNSLKYLDLSMCLIGKGSALMQLESLEILILYNCTMTYPDVVSTICQLKKLRVLDLSRQAMEIDSLDSISTTQEDPKFLDHIVSRLPQLTRLDISGTNLVGGKDRTISAFEARADRPFEFLGLFHTGNDAAYRTCIPALFVAGEATETQLLNACEAYIDRPSQLSKALNDLYNLYKTTTPSETFDNINRALEVVLPVLSKHLVDEQVIIYTTALLWCIVKINVSSKNLNDARVRRTITSRLLDVMHYHKKSRVILINGGLTLLFLPDIICEHPRVAAISLLMCRDPDPRTQGFGTTLLNTLACQVGGDQKVLIGNLHAIETMIYIIKSKIYDNTCDETLETAWSTLWNITDETPINCQRFLECYGLEAFEQCMDRFGDNKEVLKNIMGLLGNVAECPKLRASFMKEEYISRFLRLLSSHVDGIECSYNACGILAHLVSEGEEFWYQHLPKNPSRSQLLEEMVTAILQWPINSTRNINYKSFEPIIRLLDSEVVAAAQLWAVFALTNLTRINPARYCPMLERFEGLSKLRRLTESGNSKFVSDLASVAVYQYERFEAEGTLAGLEQCDSTDLAVVKNFRAESNAGDETSEMGEHML